MNVILHSFRVIQDIVEFGFGQFRISIYYVRSVKYFFIENS